MQIYYKFERLKVSQREMVLSHSRADLAAVQAEESAHTHTHTNTKYNTTTKKLREASERRLEVVLFILQPERCSAVVTHT